MILAVKFKSCFFRTNAFRFFKCVCPSCFCNP